jgi:hypothetical protein
MRILTLIDGVKRAANNPTTFAVPSLAEKEAVKVGDFVKVGWETTEPRPDMPMGERMWVMVTILSETGEYTGKLDNAPFVFPDELTFGQEVKFREENILSILKKGEV